MLYREKRELIKSIIYYSNPEVTGSFLGIDSVLYRSLDNLFRAFWIRSNPHQLYLVGGCVRDMLLGINPKDYDLCTNATPDEVKQICDAIGLRYYDSGIKHGTLTIIDDFYQQSYEITTYRQDGKYTDHRHCDEVTFTPSLEEDLQRRDFTINSFAYNFLTKELLMLDKSYLDDLNLGIIRTVGNAEDRFEEDALRMLRAIRFSAQFNFTISKDTYDAIKNKANLLTYISKERIRDELTKILLSDNPQQLILLSTTDLEEYLFDGYTPIKANLECNHENIWHYTDVFHHTLDVIKMCPKDFIIRWAAFFHDLGKPACKKLKEGSDTHYTYYKHQDISAECAMIVMDMLKFSNEQKKLIYKYVKYHDKDLANCKISTFKNILTDIGQENFINFIKLKYADAIAHNLFKDTKYAIEHIDIIKKRFNQITEENQALTLKDLAIDGYDITADGFLKGKEVGDCLRWMLNIVLEHPEYNTREKLLELLLEFKEMSSQSS